MKGVAVDEKREKLEPGAPDAAALARLQKLAEVGLMTATILHELKQPLSGIKGFTQMLLAGDPKPEERCRLILGQVKRLEDLIESNQRLLQPRVRADGRTDLVELVRDASRLFEPRVRQAGVSLALRLPDQPLLVAADAGQLMHALTNLVANALDALAQAGTPGRVEIVVREREGAPEVLVADTGAGIAPGSEGRLFTAFFTTKGPDRGLGLGLFLSRRLALENGASLDLVAPAAAGLSATTVFRLRFGAEGRPARSPAVLVVDDEEVVCELLKSLLEPDGLQLFTARSGSEALELVAQHHYDLVISDKNLPGASGLQIARAVRENNPECPVILITGYSSLESAEEALTLGVDDYIEKPFDDIANVRERVREVLRAAPPALEPAQAGPTREVLVVCSLAREAALVAEAVTAAGGVPRAAATVAEAIAQVRVQTAGVVLLDELLAQLTPAQARALRCEGRVPLVVLGERASLERTVAAIRAGAVAQLRARLSPFEMARELAKAFDLGAK